VITDRRLAARVRFLKDKRGLTLDQIAYRMPGLTDEELEDAYDDAVRWSIPASDGEEEAA